MTHLPAGSSRDTAALAQRYAQTSHWQRERGQLLIDIAAPQPGELVADLGCGTGELSTDLARRVGPSGRVVGIDPAAARLEHAKAAVPSGLDNLDFVQASAEDLAPLDAGSFDLVFSNYAAHWVLDQPAMLDEVRRILRPGGRFVAEFLSEPIPLLMELVRMMPNSDALVAENCFLDPREWRSMIASRGFEIERFDQPSFELVYDGLASLFDWLEPTSHGAFDRHRVAPAARRELERRYPGEIACLCKAFQMAIRRGG